jgi:hypothetical protein
MSQHQLICWIKKLSKETIARLNSKLMGELE